MKFAPEKISKVILLFSILAVPLVISPSTTYLYSPKTPLLQVLGFSALAAIFFKKKRFEIKTSRIDIPVVLFAVWTGITIFSASNKFFAAESFVFLLSLVSMYFVVSKTKIASLKVMSLTVSLAAGIASLYGMLQFFGFDFLTEPHSQPVSTFGNVNFAGEFTAPAIILTLRFFSTRQLKNKNFFSEL